MCRRKLIPNTFKTPCSALTLYFIPCVCSHGHNSNITCLTLKVMTFSTFYLETISSFGFNSLILLLYGWCNVVKRRDPLHVNVNFLLFFLFPSIRTGNSYCWQHYNGIWVAQRDTILWITYWNVWSGAERIYTFVSMHLH